MKNAKAEVLRYLGYQGQELTPGLDLMIEDCMQVMRQAVSPFQTRKTFNIRFQTDGIHLENTGITLSGKDIRLHLAGCGQAVLLAATLGAAADSLIRHWEAADITRSLVFDACATQYIEQCCDELEEQVKQEASERGLAITSRFSPGYGDLPLDTQPKLLAVLDAGRRIGLTCTERFILIPRKSVTALIGLGKDLQKRPGGCESCPLNKKCSFMKGKRDCEYKGIDPKQNPAL